MQGERSSKFVNTNNRMFSPSLQGRAFDDRLGNMQPMLDLSVDDLEKLSASFDLVELKTMNSDVVHVSPFESRVYLRQ